MAPQGIPRSAVMLVALGMLLVASGGALDDADAVVAARIEVCEQCRLNELPEVRRFLDSVLPTYPSLSKEDVAGAEPTIQFLNRFAEVVASTAIGHLTVDGIEAALVEHGIFVWTPHPEYLPRPIEPTSACLAWRQTSDCKGNGGKREPMGDERCTVRIAFDRSGYCECTEADRVYLDCDHDEGSCDQYCEWKLGDRVRRL